MERKHKQNLLKDKEKEEMRKWDFKMITNTRSKETVGRAKKGKQSWKEKTMEPWY